MGYLNANEIQLAEDSIFKKSMLVGLNYILHIDVDRLLAPSYEVHGLTPPNGAKRYDGWERKGASNWGASKDSFTLAGHSLGHWMSAAASFWFDHHNEDALKKLQYVVGRLSELQEKTGSGYIGGCLEDTFIKAFNGDTNWCQDYWVPWYGIHKIYQGLIDTYLYTKDQSSLKVLIGFADWALAGTTQLTDNQMQAMLDIEHGGMNEIFAELYAITKEDKYLKAAKRFTHDKIINPLINHEDFLTGLHANTQIPKVIGAACIYTQAPKDYTSYKTACEHFFDLVVNKRSYVIGGNSIAEHFEAKGAESLGIKTCESCNTYNMLRLTEYLFLWNHDSRYMDYYENALYNHILGQQEPETGAKEYFISLLQGHHRVYEKIEESWWCCTGTGMENPARYKRCMLFTEDNALYFNLYMPSNFTWKEKGLSFSVETHYPYSNTVTIKIVEGSSQDVTLYFRAPSWLTSPLNLSLNGESVAEGKGQYIALNHSLSQGDIIVLTLPMAIRTYNSREEHMIAFQYGPLTLGSKLQSVQNVPGVIEFISDETKIDTQIEEPAYLLTTKTEAADIVEPLSVESLSFKIPGQYTSTGKDIILQPFYTIHHHFYNVYWNLNKKISEFAKALNTVSIDRVEPDGQQDEIGHGLVQYFSTQGHFIENNKLTYYRKASGNQKAAFSYVMNIKPNHDNFLYLHFKDKASLNEHAFILVNDMVITERKENAPKDLLIKIPKQLIPNTSQITVCIQVANETAHTGSLTEMRTLSAPIDLSLNDMN